MLVPLNITGGSYQSRSRPLSAQVTRNFYPELQDETSTQERYVLQSFPGYKLFGTAGAANAVDRGMLFHQGVLHKISGINLYTVDSSGVHTLRGTVTGSLPCVMTGFSSTVLIATGEGKLYVSNGTTVVETTDVDLESPTSVAFLNQRAIVNGSDARWAVSAVGDSTDFNALDYATAESSADDLVRVYAFDQRVLLFGEKVLEPWFNSDVGRPPYDRIEQGIMTIGLASRMSVANNDTYFYFLADDRRVYRGVDSVQPVSNIAISAAFESYATVNDAIGFCFTLQGQNFYQLTFPTEDHTWVYSESVGQWFELSRSGSKGRALSNSYAFAYGKHLVGDYNSSIIYELDVDTFTENGAAITRTRVTGPLHGGLIGSPGSEIEFDRFELILERGVGLISGQGSDPIIMLELSTDGGNTFGTEIWAHIGKSAQFMHKVEWHGLGRASEFLIRITASDPVPYSIHSANADIEVTI